MQLKGHRPQMNKTPGLTLVSGSIPYLCQVSVVIMREEKQSLTSLTHMVSGILYILPGGIAIPVFCEELCFFLSAPDPEHYL